LFCFARCFLTLPKFQPSSAVSPALQNIQPNPKTTITTNQNPKKKVALLDEDEQLPFMHTVHRAKIVWTVIFDGAIGEANLVRSLGGGTVNAAVLTPARAPAPTRKTRPKKSNQSNNTNQHHTSKKHPKKNNKPKQNHKKTNKTINQNQVIKYNTSFQDAAAGRLPKNGELSLRIRREAAGPASDARLAKALASLGNACQVCFLLFSKARGVVCGPETRLTNPSPLLQTHHARAKNRIKNKNIGLPRRRLGRENGPVAPAAGPAGADAADAALHAAGAYSAE
jgi:hypothetical protein